MTNQPPCARGILRCSTTSVEASVRGRGRQPDSHPEFTKVDIRQGQAASARGCEPAGACNNCRQSVGFQRARVSGCKQVTPLRGGRQWACRSVGLSACHLSDKAPPADISCSSTSSWSSEYTGAVPGHLRAPGLA